LVRDYKAALVRFGWQTKWKLESRFRDSGATPTAATVYPRSRSENRSRLARIQYGSTRGRQPRSVTPVMLQLNGQ
jgi:hypothetical protein